MKIFKNFLIRLALSFLLIGALSTCEKPDKGLAGPIDVTIKYDVNGNPQDDRTKPFFFDPYEVVFPKNKKKGLIRLKIETPGYSFSPNLIKAFKITPANNDILLRSIGKDNKTIILLNLNRDAEEYKYGVVIVKDADGTEYDIDPRIKNGGGAGDQK